MTLALRTPRLLLRPWRDEDAESFAAMSADPEVTKLLLGPFDRAKSDEWMAWARNFWREHGYGQWVVEVPGEAAFAVVVGLNRILWQAHFTPAVEVAWRAGAAGPGPRLCRVRGGAGGDRGWLRPPQPGLRSSRSRTQVA